MLYQVKEPDFSSGTVVQFWFCKHLPNQACLNYQKILHHSNKVDHTLAYRTKWWWYQYNFHGVGLAWICCTHQSPHLWCIRLCCLAPLPCRQWWIWFISVVASSAHSHSAGWQWQTGAGSPHICLANTAEQGRRGRWLQLPRACVYI